MPLSHCKHPGCPCYFYWRGLLACCGVHLVSGVLSPVSRLVSPKLANVKKIVLKAQATDSTLPTFPIDRIDDSQRIFMGCRVR